MNYLYISPDFPPNFQEFIINLTKLGVNVYGIGESHYDEIPKAIQNSLKWYEKANLHVFSHVKHAVARIIENNPSLKDSSFDIIESHNEYWMRLEAYLNEELGVKGISKQDINRIKKKSMMKKVFRGAGLTVAEGEIVRSEEEAISLASKLDYPVILKPDEGVGGSGVFKLNSADEIHSVFPGLNEEYIMEEYMPGQIHTYDGLCDYDGTVIYESSLTLSHGILDYLQGEDIAFYTIREIPEELATMGRKLVKAFELKRKFFHFEFFYIDGKYIPLEINARPPGGVILDMMNYAFDSDLYYHYAKMILDNSSDIPNEKKYFVIYLSRKDGNYLTSHDEIVALYGDELVEYTENHPLYWEAMGKYRYIFKTETKDSVLKIMETVLKRQ
jgi:glutathione synthase/RimK-type ligase-like ATP-grasp enzyme